MDFGYGVGISACLAPAASASPMVTERHGLHVASDTSDNTRVTNKVDQVFLSPSVPFLQIDIAIVTCSCLAITTLCNPGNPIRVGLGPSEGKHKPNTDDTEGGRQPNTDDTEGEKEGPVSVGGKPHAVDKPHDAEEATAHP